MNLFSLTLIFLLSGFFLISTAYAESASIDVNIENTKGDRVGHYEMTIFVYEQNKDTPILEINPTSNPYVIDSLELGKHYQIDVYVNNMYGESTFVTLDEIKKSVTIPIPISGGLRFTVLYNDAYTPIDGASVTIFSHDGKSWRNGITSMDGKTMRFWMQPTSPSEFYEVDVTLSPELVFKGPKVTLTPSSQPEIVIVTNWPSIIDKLITVESIKNNGQKISKSDGDFIVELIDADNNVVETSQVNIRGESHFTNIKVGEYTLRLVKTTYGPLYLEEWGSKKVSISGAEDLIRLDAVPYVKPTQSSPDPETTVEQPEQIETQPESTGEKKNCNCVAFRLDDVQDFWLSKPQIRLINYFQDNEIPLTLGLIGSLIGDDPNLVNLIKEKLSPGNAPLELANHSWTNQRLTDKTKQEQSEAIQKTNDRILEIFGKKPTTFIPPGNLFNDETIQVIKENSITHLSASTLNGQKISPLSGLSFYHLPKTAETGHYGTGDTHFVGVSSEQTFTDIQESIRDNGYAIVMMHPQEFSIWRDGANQNEDNEEQFEELEKLIAKINSERLDIVPIEKLNLDATDRENFVYRFSPTCNCVAFRLDTVQDWWMADVNTAIIKEFNQNNMPLTIGVIGNFIGTDSNLVEFLKKTLNQNADIEIANNGWNYEDFTTLSQEEQKQFLIQSNDSIQNTLGFKPTVFIPPHNRYDDSTLNALGELGFSHISSSYAISKPPYSLEKESLYRFPFTASTGIFDSEKFRFMGLPHQTTFDSINDSVEKNGFAVVSMTAQEFANYDGEQVVDLTNEAQLNELTKLLKLLANSNYKVVSINQINLDSKVSLNLPSWIKNNAGWWAEEKITESDFTSGIEYMIKENIIKIPNLPKSDSTSAQQVPDWIKNNAGWWSQGLISDEDFVNGIEFLIKNGIILV